MKWTNEQQNAIDLPVSDLIVSAAAGSGKTAVMAERIIKRLTADDGVDIDKILIVTYTSAAASEIKERIMKKIIEKLSDGDENDRLSNQLIKLPYAHISTIHSFCLDIIKKYFYVLGIDPAVKIADEAEVEMIKVNTCQELFSKYYENDDEEFKYLLTDYTEKSDLALREAVISLYDFSRTMPNPFKWLDSLVDAYTSDSAPGQIFLTQCARAVAEVALLEYESAINLCADNSDCIILKNFLQKEHDEFKKIMSNENYDEIFAGLTNFEFANWREAKGNASIRNLCKEKRDSAKKLITKDIMEKYFLYSSDEIKADNKKVLPHIIKLSELTKEFSRSFEEKKKENNIIDFSDFEHMALRILSNPDGTPSDIAKTVSEGFEEIYVDEYQDCNNIQNTIFKYISGELRGKPNVFCVGDMKQSIYRFRDSNPLLFKNKCDEYKLYDGSYPELYNKILLNSNFRSRKGILKFVNSLFSQIMSTECGELDYTAIEYLNYGSGFCDVNPDTDFIDIDIIDNNNGFDSSAEPHDYKKLSSLEAEAVHVAKKIKNYVDGGYLLYDQKNKITRPANYGDIVVLLRSTKVPAPVFEKVFSDMGIPVYSDRGSGYFESEEIKLILSFLKIVDNPDDDISLVSVMRSPLFGFNENMLLKIRMSFRDVSFYNCIKNYAASKDDDIAIKIRGFLQTLEKYYLKSRYMDTAEFMCYMIADMNFYTYLSIFPDSKVKKTNVRFLLKKAKEFEKNNFRGIYSFVKYIDSFKEKGDIDGAKVLSENDNVVRIMSIHKSKGLEFPIVFVSALGRRFNKKDLTQKFVMHTSYGIGVDCVYRESSSSFKSLNKLAIKMKLAYEAASEELRVLYVALTRATEKLVLTACLDKAYDTIYDIEDTAFGHIGAIKPYYVFSSPNFITTVLLGVARMDGYKALYKKQNNLNSDGCNINVSHINIQDIFMSDSKSIPVDWQTMFDNKSSGFEVIKDSLDYKYPHRDAFLLPSNMTVTELKKMTMENEAVYNPFEDVTLVTPKEFGFRKKITGASLGSLVHLIMEHIKFDASHTLQSVLDELDKMMNDGILSSDERSFLDAKKFLTFFHSDTGKLMCENADTLKREFSFKYLADAEELFDFKSDEKIIVQGTIDAFFETKDEEIVIVDYKTDKVIDGDSSLIAERYHSQLDYYAKALEKALGKKVRRKILYLFDVDESIDV